MSAGHLYFIALIPPNPVFEELVGIKEYFAGTYQSKAALRSPPHITMQPPFRWNETEEARLNEELEAFSRKQKYFELTLDGFGAFAPKVIFVTVPENQMLNELQVQLCARFKSFLDISNEDSRPFRAHLTVAFRDLSRAKFHDAWKEFEHRQFRSRFVVKDIALLKHNGSFWEVARKFALNC